MRFFQLIASVVFLAASLVVVEGAAPVLAATYSVTTGAYNGTRFAAGQAVAANNCNGTLSQNELTALMLSIPVWEVAGGNASTSVSPMTLSRWDTWSLRPENHNLYSHVEYASYKRAHWGPGVGLFQIDTFAPAIHLNQGQRMQTHIGGRPIAEYLRQAFCNNTIQSALNNTWYACRWGKCWNTFNDMYNAASDSLNVTKTAGSQWDGGLEAHSCRWGPTGSPFACSWVNTNLHEGWMDTTDPFGNGLRTPLAVAFLSFSTGSATVRKRDVWLRSSGLGKEIVKWVPQSGGARDAGNWYDGTILRVWKCSGTSCWWSTWGLVVL